MKKLIILTFTIFAFCLVSLNAQISIGPRAGINLATWTDVEAALGTTNADISYVLGLNFGAVAEIPISGRFIFQPEVNFIQKGFVGEENTGLGTAKGTVTLNYIDVNTLLKYKYMGQSVGGYAAIGPYFGYALNGKITEEITFGGNTSTNETDLMLDDDDSEFNRFEFGASFGAGLIVPISEGPELFFDVRYLLGFSNLDDSGADVDVNNRGIGISVGALFGL